MCVSKQLRIVPGNDSNHHPFHRCELIAEDGRSGDSYSEDQRMTLRDVSRICPSFVTLVSIFAGKK
jgi:hypothetical protein